MIKSATVSTSAEERYKEQAYRYLTQIRQILKRLQAESAAAARRPKRKKSVIEEVKEILRG